MAVDLSQVVEALRQQLEDNAANFVRSFVPERSYADWDLALEDADKLHVDVVLVTTEIQTNPISRHANDVGGDVEYIVPIDVGIRQRFGQSEEEPSSGRISVAEIDQLVLLETQIFEYLYQEELTTYTAASWEDTRIVVACSREHLRQNRQFTGIIRTTYNVVAPPA